MNRIIFFTFILGIAINLQAQEYILVSPDKSITINVAINENGCEYSVLKNNETLIKPSGLGMTTNLFVFDSIKTVINANKTTHTIDFEPIWGISNTIHATYNQLELQFDSALSIQFRAYNSGIAWRFVTNHEKDLIVFSEKTELNLNKTSTVYLPETEGFSTPFEANYLPQKLEEISKTKLGLTPLLIKTSTGTNMIVSEVNLENYPGMFLELNSKGLNAVFPSYPSKEKEQWLGRWRLTNIPQLSKKMVSKTEDYLAVSVGSRNFPWRAILIETEDKDLLNNQLIALLADKPNVIADFSWVNTGKVVWDWYYDWNLQGVDFKAGINTPTYKYMIDFAAKNQLEYVNIDDGWCKLHNFKKVNKDLDLDGVLAYAEQKQVGIFLWSTWQTLESNLTENLDYFQDLGIAGLKVDFFDRCDQKVVDFVNLLAKECASRKLLLNLHGMYKPTGLQITYPNIVNFEGVLGLEYNKFSDQCTPTHNVTIPFVRNAVGPMDYTPGAMRYVDSASFEKSWSNPHVMSTRVQQMAMYVVYYGGVQMLADSPTLFEKDSIALNFLKKVPVSWDETVAIDGKLGEYAIVARRKGNDWYIAGINGSKATDVEFNLNFLPQSNYNLNYIEQGNSASELKISSQEIENKQAIKQQMKPMGGFIMHLMPIK